MTPFIQGCDSEFSCCLCGTEGEVVVGVPMFQHRELHVVPLLSWDSLSLLQDAPAALPAAAPAAAAAAPLQAPEAAHQG